MLVEDLAGVLASLGIEAEEHGGQLHAVCPNPDHPDAKPSWAIRATVDRHPHGCWSCGYRGNVFSLVVDRLQLKGPGRYAEAEEWLRGKARTVTAREVVFRLAHAARPCALPDGVVMAPVDAWPAMARDYVLSRVAAWQVRSWGLGYAMQGRLAGRVVFPAYSAEGDLTTYTARSFVGDEPRFLSGDERADGARADGVFGEDRWDPSNPLVLAEGAVKALAVERAAPGVSVAALFGSQPSALHAWKLSRFAHVVVMTDRDRAGDHAAFALSSLGGRASRLAPRADPDELPAAEVATLVASVLRARGLSFRDGRWR